MKQLLSVFNTDSINRYGFRFSVEALMRSLWKEHDVGIPMLFGHDSLRPIGWTYPIAVHFEPGLTRLAGLGMLIENDEDAEHFSRQMRNLFNSAAEGYKAEIDYLMELLQQHLNGKEKLLFSKECLVLVEYGLCVRTFPDLFSSKDDDGLIQLNELTPIGPGVFKIDEFAVFAHSFFRRSLSKVNSLNSPFLKRLQDIKNDLISVKIALDPDMIGLASTYQEYEELQYWWGPKFDDNLASIPAGVTHYEADEAGRVFSGISSTQFWWQSRDDMHIFEAEELRDTPSIAIDEGKFGCRYVHSIVQESSKNVTHFDGAVRVYQTEKMIERLNVDIAHSGRHTEYTKLWRIDGMIPIPLWKELLCDYFRDNRLVGEYLGAVEDESSDSYLPDRVKPVSLVSRYVPYSMRQGDGIRIALSYHFFEDFTVERKVVPLDKASASSGTDNLDIVDSWVVELKKLLNRLGCVLVIPDDIYLISHKDFYVNLPLIVHNKNGLPENLHKTLEGIESLITGFRIKGFDQVVAYTIGFPVEGKELRVSVLGHIEDLGEWLSNPLSTPPVETQDEIYDWAEKVSAHLQAQYPVVYDNPPIFETLMHSGVLLAQRKQVDNKFNIEYEMTDKGLMYKFRIPDDEMHLKSAIEKGYLTPALAYLKLESKCIKCGRPYRVCDCSKLLDIGVAEEVTEVRVAFPFWTDRPLQ
ncbi:MAG: hypothetical protein KF753_04120 [Caldilineaceae bacterium]|nr:hypothetical protein [Caldilineaceae bacterium]